MILRKKSQPRLNITFVFLLQVYQAYRPGFERAAVTKNIMTDQISRWANVKTSFYIVKDNGY